MLETAAALRAPSIVEDEFEASFVAANRSNFPCICLPPRRSFFHGRAETIKAMQDHLCSPDKKTFCRSFAVYGTPGAGKTGLALHFAYRCADENLFDAILWIRAETDLSCKQSFTEVADSLELIRHETGVDHDASVLAVITWLRKTKKSWLLIYDNLEQLEVIKNCLPSRSVAGSILITTRYSHVAVKFEGDSLSRELLPFNDNDTIAVFNGFRSQYHQDSASPVDQLAADHGEDARYIIQVVGGLALGIEHIAAYMENDRLTVAQFRRNYERMASSIHKKESTGSRAPYTIDTLWAMALDQAEQAGPETFSLLQVLAFLAPDSVSLRLFPCEDNSEWTDFDQDLTEFTFFYNSAEHLDTAVTQLQRLALVRRLSGDTISIHRLLQKSVFYRLDQQSRQKAFDVASKLVNISFPKQINDEPLGDRWDECQDYIEHAQTLASLFTVHCRRKESQLRASEDLQELMTNSTWYLYESGDLMAAYSLVLEAWKMFPDPDNSLHYAHLCNTAAVIYFDWNQLKKSDDEHMKCLQIRSKLVPENHLLISSTIMNLGQVYSALGRFTEAEQKFEEYRQMNLRTGVPLMVQSHGLDCMIIGRALFLQNRLGEARKSFDESRRCLIEAFGDSSVLLAYLMLAYGNLELAENNIAKAQIAYEKGYTMVHKLAPTHGLIVALHYKLGYMHYVLGNYELGLSHCKAGLPIADLRKLRGDKARLLYLKSLCLDGLAAKGYLLEDEDYDDAVELRRQAELEKDELLKIQDIAISPERGDPEVYDHLVCAYVR
ncbi:P-loop containing nucleoside triphosphate hydrolase protein [Nemania sp. FL0031]|nr:P-loop containing nucleoside triphosphate hydrolase protein [Nemania sp. FL0031]